MPKTLPMKSLLDFERFFEEAQQRGASDVHLQSGVVPMMRINGILVPAEDAKVLSAKEVQAIITAGLTKDQLARFENDLELDTAFALKNGMRLRLNIYKEKNMPALSARLIPAEIPDMEWINAQDTLYAFAELTQGLVLVTGPTGHGKSTTVAAMLEHINQNRKENIITLEDPMEFLYQPKESIISQRELGLDMKSFASGIKHVLRQDPNVVLVGEMRDLETIAATITLAETGHLVFATLHTNSAWQTIDRIIDVFPTHQQPQIRLQLSLTLRGVISQILLPKKDYSRIAAREIMLNTPAISNLIREGKTEQMQNYVSTNKASGMQSLDQDLHALIKQGLIEIDDAKRFARNPRALS